MISAVLFLSATGAQAAGFSQQGNSLTVQLKQHQNQGPSQIRLQVVSDKIIRVQATAEQSFRNKQSLIIVPQESKAKYQVEEQGDNLVITTSAMRAVLNEATGHIAFYDLKGNVLSNEVAQGGKTSSHSLCQTVRWVLTSPRCQRLISTDGLGMPSSTVLTTRLSMAWVSIRARNST